MVNNEKTKPSGKLQSILLLVVVCLLVLIPTVSAFSFDNVLNYDNSKEEIIVTNAFNLGSDLIKATLQENDCDEDMRYCQAVLPITLYEAGHLIQDKRFYTINGEDKYLQDIRQSSFERWGAIDDYETQCSDGEPVTYENGTYTPRICKQVIVSSHEGWIKFTEKDEFNSGDYLVRFSGEKKSSRIVDWQIKIKGEWTTPWAIWGNISLGDDAEVILNSPADDSIAYLNLVNFNATANVTGATFTNMSLWTNETGDWAIRNTTNLSPASFSEENLTETPIAWVAPYILIKSFDLLDGYYITNGTNEIRGSNQAHQTNVLYQFIYQDDSQANSSIASSSGVSIWRDETYLNPDTSKLVKTINVWAYMSSWGTGHDGSVKDDRIFGTFKTSLATTTWNRTLTDTTLWNIQACDSDGDCGFAPANYTVLLDDEAPTINITSGNGTQSYGLLSQNHTINYTITDSNLNSCWIDYNGTNNSIGCVSGEANSTSFALVKDLYTATIYANDSVGNLNSKLISWSYIFLEETSTFENIVYETDYKTFEINITIGLNILTQSGNLIYNGTTYTATSSCASGVCTFTKELDIPLISSGESEIRSFFWSLILFDGNTSYNLNTSSSIQNTTRIHLEECAGVYTTTTLNFTAYYETNLTRINPFYIAGTFDTWLGSGAIYRTQSFNKESTSELKLCITPTNKTQYSNAHIDYKFENENITFIPRNYFFQNKTLTNISEEINLLLLEAKDSTSFIIKVQDQKLSPVVDALVYIKKYYPSDGEYRTVQIARTDSNGETLGFYETETVDYKHIIIKNGETLLETAKQKVVGKSVPFTLTFTIGTSLGFPWTSFEDNQNVSINLTFDKDTNIVTMTYIENITGSITSGQLLVIKNSLTNSTSTIICNKTSTEASVTLTCDLSAYDGTFTAIAYINGGSEKIIEFIITDARDVFGSDGLFLGMMIIMVGGFAMMWNPSAGIVSINAAVIFVNLIGFITVSPIFIFGMISVSVITIILLKT